MRPIEELMTEHRAIEVMLGILEGACRRLEAGQEVPREHLEEMVEFLRVFADGCHHGKEEDFLFPALTRAGLPGEGGPVGVMLEEHAQGRELVGTMTRAVAGGRDGLVSGFVPTARAYAQLLRAHIQKEDGVLFPLAQAHLGPEVEEELRQAFQQVEEERVGAGRHQTFHRLLEELEAVYAE